MSEEEIQRTAQERLDAAVERFLADVGWKRGMVTTGWALVLHQVSFDENAEYEETYPIIYMDGSMSDHIAMGLLQKGLDILRGIDPYHRRSDEDNVR